MQTHTSYSLLAGEEKIPELTFPEGEVNAFSALWQKSFYCGGHRPFFSGDGTSSAIPYVFRVDHFACRRPKNGDFSMIEVPCHRFIEGDNFSFVIFFPGPSTTFTELQELLTAEFIDACRRQASKIRMALYLPQSVVVCEAISKDGKFHKNVVAIDAQGIHHFSKAAEAQALFKEAMPARTPLFLVNKEFSCYLVP